METVTHSPSCSYYVVIAYEVTSAIAGPMIPYVFTYFFWLLLPEVYIFP